MSSLAEDLAKIIHDLFPASASNLWEVFSMSFAFLILFFLNFSLCVSLGIVMSGEIQEGCSSGL